MSWVSIALLVCAVAVLVAAEWPRLDARVGRGARVSRERARNRARFRIVESEQPVARSESEEFAASVERDLSLLPTIDDREERGGR